MTECWEYSKVGAQIRVDLRDVDRELCPWASYTDYCDSRQTVVCRADPDRDT